MKWHNSGFSRKTPLGTLTESDSRPNRPGPKNSIRLKSKAEQKKKKRCSTPASITPSPARIFWRAKASSSSEMTINSTLPASTATTRYRYGTPAAIRLFCSPCSSQIPKYILRSQLDIARESGYMGTSFHGDNADLMFLGDWQRGLDFDWASAYPYLRKNATDPNGPRGHLAEYMQKGWISDFIPKDQNPSPPYADGNAGVATTLEYSWDDHALALYAKKLGKQDDYELFLKRAHNYKNVFDPSIGFMRGKTADGNWISPFDPREPYYNFMMKEASGWSTLWLVPHDVQGLMDLLGGREKFAAKLDEFFSTPYTAKGICRDCTGVIGQYVQGNQPDQQAAYYYDWAGQPWKTQELSRRILNLMYGSDHTGLAFPGMDDQGATSSWYVMSALGFYPVDPSSPDYIMGSPIFSRAVIHMGNGKDFTIIARNNSAKNVYI